MAASYSLTLYLCTIFTSYLFASVGALPASFLADNTSHLLAVERLVPRQCVKVQGTFDYRCDFNLPTLKEMVVRLRDTSDDGLVDADRSMAFYSNLPVESEEQVGELIAHWFRYNPDPDNSSPFCWFFDCLGWRCMILSMKDLLIADR